MSNQRRRAILGLVMLAVACDKPYRVGEFVLVEWEEDVYYPAYIIDVKGPTRYRVHYDGYSKRWDEDVTLDRIKGRVEGIPARPPPPLRVARAQGLLVASESKSGAKGSGGGPAGVSSAIQVGQYKVGDRVSVKWRGATYAATVVSVLADNQYRVHYEGYESAWDEDVPAARITDKR